MHKMADLAASDVVRGSDERGLKTDIKYEIAGKFMPALLARALFHFREQKKVIAEVSGHDQVVTHIDEKLAAMAAETEYLEEQLQALIKLAKKFRSRDWELIYRFAPEVSHWHGLMVSLPYQVGAKSPTYVRYTRERNLAEQRMVNLNKGRPNISDSEMQNQLADDPQTPEFRRLKNRIEFLQAFTREITAGTGRGTGKSRP